MERVYNIPMKNNLGEEVRQMCSLSEGIEQKGIEKGIQQMVVNALKSISIEQVAEILLLPVDEVRKIAENTK